MLSWKIALRYLFSKKSHNAVNVISAISMVGVAVATAAIVIVLSVFNGFSDLAESHLSALDPVLKVYPASGKVIADADSVSAALLQCGGVTHAMPVIEERGLVIYGNNQMPVIFKGVADGYDRMNALDSIIIDGIYTPGVLNNDATQLSVGVAMQTGARPMPGTVLNLYVPRRTGRINPANPAAAFRSHELTVSGVFRVNQAEYDSEMMIIPLAAARDLLQYTTEASAIEVAGDISADRLREMLGLGFVVKTRIQQQEKSFRMIAIEKWVTFLMLAFILMIASFNIISTLSLMVIEKRDNMTTLRWIGATGSMVRRIFMIQGWLITMIGGIAGIALGSVLVIAQQTGGFVKLAGDPANLAVTVYPVRLAAADLLTVLMLVAVIAFITSQTTRFFTKK